MADREERKRQKKNDRVLKKPEIESIMKRINDNDKRTSQAIYGADQEFANRNAADLEVMRGTIRNVTSKFKEVTGDGIIEFLTKMVVEEEREQGKANKRQLATSDIVNKGRINIKELLENPNNGIVSDLFMKDKGRINLYDDYQALFDYIPQLSEAISVIADNIISPDDFTKNVFSIFYNNRTSSSVDSEKAIIENLKELERIYKVESFCKDWITDTLTKGDKFVAVLSLRKEFDHILAENGGAFPDQASLQVRNEAIQLESSSLALSEAEVMALDRVFQRNDDKNEKPDKKEWANTISEMLNNNVQFVSSPAVLLSDKIILENDFMTSADPLGKFVGTRQAEMDEFDNSNIKPNVINPMKQTDDSESSAVKFAKKYAKKDKNDKSENDPSTTNINGSFLKELDPRRTLKIQIGETCFGYYYFETDEEIPFLNGAEPTKYNMSMNFRSSWDFDMNDTQILTAKRTLVDLFTRNIGRKINKKFVENNKEFKHIIYELLNQRNILDRRMRIVYIPPNDVVHFKLGDEKGYGISKFKRILFTAKLYLAVLTSTLMMKISRSIDHRTFYIETGLSKDVEGVIQSFIREIKSKEVKLNDLDSINTIFNAVGQLIMGLSLNFVNCWNHLRAF